MVEVDTGLDRAGVALGDPLERLVAEVRKRPSLRRHGIATHEGYAYSIPDPLERERVVRPGWDTGHLLTLEPQPTHRLMAKPKMGTFKGTSGHGHPT